MDDRLVERLRADGRAAAEGEMTLDQGRARRKLQKFQLQDPHEYVLQFVEAAHLLGASRIEIEVDADEVEVRFDGAPISREELDSIYAAAFRRRDDDRTDALRHVAIGLIAAREVDPAIIRVESGTGQADGAVLVEKGRDEHRVEAHSAPKDATTRIYLRETLRASHVPAFFHKFQGELTEQKLLREGCRFASIPILLNGENVADRADPRSDVLADVEFETRFESGTLGIRSPDALHVEGWRGAGRAWLVQNGVQKSMCQFGGDLAPARPLAVVKTQRLRKNLSQSAFVEDESWRRLTGELLPAVAVNSLQVLVAELTDADVRDYRDWLARLFWTICERVVEGRHGAGERRLLEQLADLPILPLATPAPPDVESTDIAGIPHIAPSLEMGTSRATRYATERVPYAPRNARGRVLLVELERVRTALKSVEEPVFGRTVDVTDRLRRGLRRSVNQSKWRERAPYERPEAVDPRFEAVDDEGHLECTHVLLPTDAPHELHAVKQGRLLEVADLGQMPLPGGVSVIRGPVEPNDLWSGAARDEQFRRAVFRLLAMLPEPLAAVAAHYSSVRNVVAPWFSSLLQMLAAGDFRTAIFDNLGMEADRAVEEFRNWYDREREGAFEHSVWSVGPPHEEEHRARVQKLPSVLGPLAEVPAFRALPGDPVTVTRAVEMADRYGRVAYIVRDPEARWWTAANRTPGGTPSAVTYDKGGWEEPVVVVKPVERELVEDLFGGMAENVDGEFERRARASDFVRRHTPTEFPEERYLASTELEEEGWSAQIGFRPEAGLQTLDRGAEPGGNSSEGTPGGVIRLELTFRRRRLGMTTVDVSAGSFHAVAESEEWSIDPEFTEVREDALYREVVDAVRSTARQLLISFCERVAESPTAASGGSLVVAWRLLSRTADEERFAALRDLPLLSTVGGDPASYEEVENQLSASGRLCFTVGEIDTERAQTPGEEAPVLRVPDREGVRGVIDRLFEPGELVEVSESGEDEELLSETRDRFWSRPVVEPRLGAIAASEPWRGEPLRKGEVAESEVQGEMVIYAPGTSDDEGVLRYVLLHERRRFSSGRLEIPFGTAGAVVSAEFVEVDRNYTRIVEGRERLERGLTAGLASGVEVIAGRVDGAAAGECRAERGAVLSWLAKLGGERSVPLASWESALQALWTCAAFPLAGDEAVTLEELRRRVDRAGRRLALAGSDVSPRGSNSEVPVLRDDAFPADVTAVQGLVVQLVRIREFLLRGRNHRGDDSSRGDPSGWMGDGRPEWLQTRDAVDEESAHGRPQSKVAASDDFLSKHASLEDPGEVSARRVVETALQAELEHLSGAASPIVEIGSGNVEIAPTRNDWVERGPEGGLRIDPDHRAIRYAVASVREDGSFDPVALAVLVSSFYTAASARFGGETDVEDFAFHTRQAARVAALLDIASNDRRNP